MGKFKMPTVQQFLQKKTMYGPKKEPVWVYLEREIIENIDKKPYNVKVGEWLKFLKDLKYYYYCEAKRKEKRLQCEVGPVWYYELSTQQRAVLSELTANIHQDLLEDLPIRVRRSLSDLGITLKLPRAVLMKAMKDSTEDPGIFIWNLYKAVYKVSPSQLRKKYDMNSMILMSCLVFIDLDECIDCLEKLTYFEKPPVTPKKKISGYEVSEQLGDGGSAARIIGRGAWRLAAAVTTLPNDFVAAALEGIIRRFYHLQKFARTFNPMFDTSYLKLCLDECFLEKRRERNKKSLQQERICNYKFWEPPSSLRNTDPKMANYANKLKMLRKRAKPMHKAPYKNVQYQVGGVSFSGGTPRYLLANVVTLPTGYIPINGGISVIRTGETVIRILGYWKFPKDEKEVCSETCDCITQWEPTVLKYLDESRCRCGHLYDFNLEGKLHEKYFYPPTKHQPYFLDQAKIYQLDPLEDFVKDVVKDALMSGDVTPEPSAPTISPSGLSGKDLLAAFLADLSDTPLLIPHLPQANYLNNLLEWVRKRVKGKLTPAEHKRLNLQSQRRWLDLKHMNFRALAYRIPFTLKQLEHMNWSHRLLVQKLFDILLDDFVSRNRLKQLEQTRLWWPTTKYDMYPSKPFLDIFFTYMPGRMKDTFLVNPYSSELTPKHGAKTCPLS